MVQKDSKQTEIQNAYARENHVEHIPATLHLNDKEDFAKAIRVAPYVRVSTDSTEQQASYELQYQYYQEYVANHPGWI